MRRKVKLALPFQKNGDSTGPGSSESKPIIFNSEAVSTVDPILPKPLSEIPRSEVLLPYILLQNRPPPKPPDQLINKQDIGNTKMDIEENSPFQENIISEIYERPDESYFQEPVKLKDLIDTRNIIHRFLPKQTDIDKILEIIRKKVLKGTHLPLTIKEIQVGYLNSIYFKDVYQYLAQNRLPSKKAAIKKVEILAEKIYFIRLLIVQINNYSR